nr:PREDICTED: claudin-15 [Latimeria chalumnae]|eukprot:XP_005997983.1 PREDICTED: claudin-15 [Latimeria chalumnae]
MLAAVQVIGYLLCLVGWVLMGVALDHDFWRESTVDGIVVITSSIYENLWRSCALDSTGVYDCREFPSLLGLSGYIQACRALMITGLLLGFFGALLGMVGLKCTKVAEDRPEAKGKIAAAGGICFILAGLCAMITASWYAFNITREFFDPLFAGTKYEIGAGLYFCWAGGALTIIGGICLCCSCKTGSPNQPKSYAYSYKAPRTTAMSTVQSVPQRRNSDTGSIGNYGKNAYV